MKAKNATVSSRESDHQEYDFALVIDGVTEITPEIENAPFDAGCDDATISMTHGRVYVEFSRSAESLEAAILSAISEIHNARIGAIVLRVDECDLVSQSEIARRIGRSRQLVHQYLAAQRGPGGFPPPACHLREETPLWQWCEVSHWLYDNNLICREVLEQAETVNAINAALLNERLRKRWSKV